MLSRGGSAPSFGRKPIVYSHGPIGPVSVVLHRSLLDLPVRTDTEGVGGGCGGCSDPLHLVRCDACGFPLSKCVCIAGRDY